MPTMRVDVPPVPLEDPDPVTFTVGYQRVVLGEDGQPAYQPEERTFTCVPRVPLGAYSDLDGRMLNAVFVSRVLRALIVPADEQAFDELTHAKDILVDWASLTDVAIWLTGEAYTDRPTVPSAPSSNGHAPTPASSTDGSGEKSETSAPTSPASNSGTG